MKPMKATRETERRDPQRLGTVVRQLLRDALAPLPEVSLQTLGLGARVVGLREALRHADDRTRHALAAHGLIAGGRAAAGGSF
jgi:hypothetical protein